LTQAAKHALEQAHARHQQLEPPELRSLHLVRCDQNLRVLHYDCFVLLKA